MAALVLLDDADAEFLFLGGGTALKTLKAQACHAPHIRFAPFVPYVQARALIASAHAGIISLQPDIYRVSYPSKTQTYLALGLPLLAVVEGTSELAHTLKTHRLGLSLEATEPRIMADQIRTFLKTLDTSAPAKAVQAYTQTALSQDTILTQWSVLFSELHQSEALYVPCPEYCDQ